MTFAIFNVFCGALVVAIILVKLLRWGAHFNAAERLGMALIGSAMVLTMPLLFPHPAVTPFDGWSASVLRLGCMIYFLGRLHRRQPLLNRPHR